MYKVIVCFNSWDNKTFWFFLQIARDRRTGRGGPRRGRDVHAEAGRWPLLVAAGKIFIALEGSFSGKKNG